MKRVLLMRHGDAKSASGLGDHGRPLTSTGIHQAQTIGRFLARCDQLPALALVSSALRTVTTFENLRAAAGRDIETRTLDALYNTTPMTVLEEIQSIPESPRIDTVMVVAHQPTMGMLSSQLIGGGQFNVPTAAVICMGFATDSWTRVERGGGWLLWQVDASLVHAVTGFES